VQTWQIIIYRMQMLVDNDKMGLTGVLTRKVAAWRWFITCGMF